MMRKTVQTARWWAVVVVALLTGPAIAARDAYVNDDTTEGDVPLPGCPAMPSGADDVGCGSCDRPCRSPSYLLQQLGYLLQLGDTIYLNTGRYHALLADEPIVTLRGDWRFGTTEGWVTLSGPVNAEGRALRDASGIPLAVLDGRGTAPAGVVVEGNGVKLRALRIENFPDAPEPLCGSAVHVMPSRIINAYAFEQLDIARVTSTIGSAIEVEQSGSTCIDCSISGNRIRASRSNSPAIWIEAQSGARIVGNHITGWGTGSNASGIRVRGSRIEILHNVIQNSAGPAVEAQGEVRVSHNTFRENARVELPPTGGVAGFELLFAGSGGATIDHNIFAPRSSRMALALETTGRDHVLDFNGYVSEDASIAYTGAGDRYRTLAEWQEATGHDLSSREGQAHFAGDADARLQSESGRWAGGAWVADAQTSDFIDAGDARTLSDETHFLHGGIPNLGAFGNTPEASLSIARLAKRGGDGQEGEVGRPLSDELFVEVRGFDRFGGIHPNHPDVPLLFRVVEGAASLTGTRVLTDSLGRARIGITPEEVGTLRIEVSVEGVPGVVPVTFEATVTGDPDGQGPTPEPEPAPGRGQYTVGSGCAQAGDSGMGLPWALLALGLLFRRRS